MNTPESDQTVDGTSKFSLDYFNLLEKLLHFEPDESGKLVIPTIDSSDLTNRGQRRTRRSRPIFQADQ